MSQFTKSINEQRATLTKRFDAVLRLRNVDPQTLDRDAHYAVFRLAELAATEFPSASPQYTWTREHISYSLPQPWETNADPHWIVECPRLTADYDEVLQADDATLLASDSGATLSVRRQFRIDDVVASVYVQADLPPDAEAVLRLIGKIQDVLEPAYTRTTSTC